MNASRILPDLQGSLVCEDVRREATGNFILVGVIDIIRVPALPVTAFRLVVFNRWTAGLGEFVECVRLLAPDQKTVLRKSELRFALKDAFGFATTVTAFPQVEFRAEGPHYVEVLVDNVLKARYPIPVVVVPPPDQRNKDQVRAQPAQADAEQRSAQVQPPDPASGNARVS